MTQTQTRIDELRAITHDCPMEEIEDIIMRDAAFSVHAIDGQNDPIQLVLYRDGTGVILHITESNAVATPLSEVSVDIHPLPDDHRN